MELKKRIQGLIQLLQQATEKQLLVFRLDKNHFDLAFGDLSYNFSPEPSLNCFGFPFGLAIPESIPILEDTYKEEFEFNEFQLYGQIKWQENKTLLHEKWVNVNMELRRWQTQYIKYYDNLVVIIYNCRIMRHRVYCATTIVAGIAVADNYLKVCSYSFIIIILKYQ